MTTSIDSPADDPINVNDNLMESDLVTMDELVDVGLPQADAASPKPARRRRRRKPVKRATIVAHRWLSLILGLALLVITTSGAAVLYAPQWVKWSNESVFHVTTSEHPLDVVAAMAIVDKGHPDFHANSVNVYDGLIEVMSADSSKYPGFYGVDPGTGTITGYANPNSGVMAFLQQVHECMFTCKSLPGYLSFLDKPMPTLGMHWLKDVTIAGFILGVAGILILFLAISGVWLWWPTIKRFSHGFRVRTGKGRYARDYDLHQLIGIVAVPFLLMWGLTGSSFEFHWVKTAWYGVTGGQQVAEDSFTSATVAAKTADITPAQALAAGQAIAGPHARIANFYLPDPDDQTTTYSVWFSRGLDPWKYGQYPGEYEVEVDRHNASLTHIDSGTGPTLSNTLLDDWGSGMFHYGAAVNGWWRIIWFLFGLTPLALAITGVSTWLAKRSVRKRRKAQQKAHAASRESETKGSSTASMDMAGDDKGIAVTSTSP